MWATGSTAIGVVPAVEQRAGELAGAGGEVDDASQSGRAITPRRCSRNATASGGYSGRPFSYDGADGGVALASAGMNGHPVTLAHMPTIKANGLEFAYLEAGPADGPLALVPARLSRRGADVELAARSARRRRISRRRAVATRLRADAGSG